MLHLVLYHPAIPQNTGNIARTTVGMGAHLHLIHPMKFEISDHAVKRAGLDYWPSVTLTEHADDDTFLTWLGERRPWLVTKHGTHRFDQPDYQSGDIIILGNENTGLPDAWHARWPDRGVCIPMPGVPESDLIAQGILDDQRDFYRGRVGVVPQDLDPDGTYATRYDPDRV